MISNTAERLKKLMASRNIRQVDIVERTGIGKSAVSHREKLFLSRTSYTYSLKPSMCPLLGLWGMTSLCLGAIIAKPPPTYIHLY